MYPNVRPSPYLPYFFVGVLDPQHSCLNQGSRACVRRAVLVSELEDASDLTVQSGVRGQSTMVSEGLHPVRLSPSTTPGKLALEQVDPEG